MSSGCISSGCVEARVPVRATYRNLYKWPESDAEFVRGVAAGAGGREAQRRRRYPAAPVVDGYSCRQIYLRSYTFSRKESASQRTRKCLGRVRERVAAAASGGKRAPGCIPLRGGRGAAGKGSDRRNPGTGHGDNSTIQGRRRRRKKKRCPGVRRRLREFSAAAFCSIFHRLLSCTTSVEVVDI